MNLGPYHKKLFCKAMRLNNSRGVLTKNCCSMTSIFLNYINAHEFVFHKYTNFQTGTRNKRFRRVIRTHPHSQNGKSIESQSVFFFFHQPSDKCFSLHSTSFLSVRGRERGWVEWGKIIEGFSIGQKLAPNSAWSFTILLLGREVAFRKGKTGRKLRKPKRGVTQVFILPLGEL